MDIEVEEEDLVWLKAGRDNSHTIQEEGTSRFAVRALEKGMLEGVRSVQVTQVT